MSDVKHMPDCDTLKPELWDALCNCAEIRAEGIKYAYMEWQDKTEWVQKTATAKELGKHRADVMKERIVTAEAERDQLREERDSHQRLCIAEMEKNSQLRAELDAIRGQETVGYISDIGMQRVKHGRSGAISKIKTKRCRNPIYALPPQQPDAVSVPRELDSLRKDAERWRFVREKQTFIWLVQDWIPGDAEFIDVDAAVDSAMHEVALSTRQAEEGE